jgi:uncharacterized repeat protein (TIGR01451 family)
MIKINTKLLRGVFTLGVAAVFAAFALFLTAPSAKMQTGANTIVFDRYDDDLGVTKIFVMNADGSNPVDLGPGFSPSWSADGTKIVYTEGDGETFDLWTMNADGSNKTRLTENYSSHSPVWSPAGNRIAFVSQHEGGWHVYMIDADGQNQARLQISDSAIFEESAPLWNHDGSKVIFQGTRATPQGARDDFYQADAANSGATQRLTFVNALFDSAKSTISPDGSKLVVRYQHALQEFLLDGSQTVSNLTQDMAESPYDPDFAPNGSRIIFQKGDTLAIMNADGTEVVGLDVVGGRPDWNPTAVIVEPTPTVEPTPEVMIDLSVDASAAPATVAVGGQTTYTVVVSNPSEHPASGVQLSAPVAATLAVGQANASQGACSTGATIDCLIGTIAPGSSVTVTVQATINVQGFVGTTFTAVLNENDPDLNNNSEVAGVTGTLPTQCAPPLAEQIEVRGNEHWDRDERTGIDTLRVTIRNRSGQTLDPRVAFVIKLNTPGVTIDPTAVAGYTQCTTPEGLPYVVGYAPNKREWKPMQDITVRIPFINPSRGAIDWEWYMYSGSLNP